VDHSFAPKTSSFVSIINDTVYALTFCSDWFILKVSGLKY
jgi:hypothetical protein